MKKQIKLKLVDFPEDALFSKLFFKILSKHYDIIQSENPDFILYTCFGENHKKYNNAIKIFYTGEPLSANFNECDYAIGFDYLNFEDRYHRFPFCYLPFVQNFAAKNRIKKPDKFCNFIYSNEHNGEGARLRKEFCLKLMQYKHIDCPGKVLNNMQNAIEPRNGDWHNGKLNFIKNYKFTIAFENTSINGYTTEKLTQPLLAGSIPVYWGNPLVGRDFNTNAFINCNDYDNNFDKVIQKIIEIDNDDDLYLKMLNENPLKEDICMENEVSKLESYLLNIFENGQIFSKNPLNFLTVSNSNSKEPLKTNSRTKENKSWAQKIFSVTNQYSCNKKYKVLTILGIKAKFKVPPPPRRNQVLNYGENNKVITEISDDVLKIKIFGNCNLVKVDTKDYFKGEINIGAPDCPVNNCTVTIGEKSTSNGTFIRLSESNTRVSIGKDCMFSDSIFILNSDSHTIINNRGNIINKAFGINIGDNIWVGRNTTILKNVKIADKSIVGCNSTVTRQFYDKNVVIAGNPAKIIKTQVDWNRLRPDQFIEKINR